MERLGKLLREASDIVFLVKTVEAAVRRLDYFVGILRLAFNRLLDLMALLMEDAKANLGLNIKLYVNFLMIDQTLNVPVF